MCSQSMTCFFEIDSLLAVQIKFGVRSAKASEVLGLMEDDGSTLSAILGVFFLPSTIQWLGGSDSELGDSYIPYIFHMNNGERFGATNRVSQPSNSQSMLLDPQMAPDLTRSPGVLGGSGGHVAWHATHA